ncbi:MAG: hypothetical protein Q8P95_02805, partial [bacterium]|nr:hypothetical protein [bacterium]
DDAALFADIDLNTLAGRAAQYLGKMRISGGRPPECADCKPNFDGNTELNKAEFSKFGIIAQLGADFAFNSSATDIKVPWDVDTSAWYWTFLRECIIRGILKNNPDGSSRPAEMINTATALEIIKRLKAPNYTFDKALLNKADFWTDVTGTDWWTDAAAFAYEKNLLPHRMKTDGGKFRADSTLTRYETAVIFYQLANSQ